MIFLQEYNKWTNILLNNKEMLMNMYNVYVDNVDNVN